VVNFDVIYLLDPQNSVRCKDLQDISYACRVIVYFVSNFFAIATRVGWGKISLAEFDGPNPQALISAKISQISLAEAEL